MMAAADDGGTTLNLIALARVDGAHVPGNLLLEKHIEEFGSQLQLTRTCLEASNDMGTRLGSGFSMMNGVHGIAPPLRTAC